eukprot:CAMPEP_0184869390 /NCGR_PEP_ID=MMETSP0580-20130426/33868_1 /TAXON_ID=1118495 /ORGANISM="Dactyliosolen fragilissimus" /LENGTH=104 /DNA_ID=CAMNT_0027370847 /DNA_START=525 /DNA_END=836 /DNA_ORIENTATION=+
MDLKNVLYECPKCRTPQREKIKNQKSKTENKESSLLSTSEERHQSHYGNNMGILKEQESSDVVTSNGEINKTMTEDISDCSMVPIASSSCTNRDRSQCDKIEKK